MLKRKTKGLVVYVAKRDVAPLMPADHCEYIFMDESGDLGPKGSKCFTIVALSTHDVEALSRIMKKVRRRKLKKKLKELSEIKAYNSNDAIRKFVLMELGVVPCSISAIVIPKTQLRDGDFEEKERLYNRLCGLLFEHISLGADRVDITIDRKSGNQLLMDDFNQYVISKIRAKSSAITVKIRHLESHASRALQAVDFVAWAFNRKYSYDEAQYYDLIRHRVTGVLLGADLAVGQEKT